MTPRGLGPVALTAVIVFFWSTGGIASEIGLRGGSPLAVLIVRYLFALALLGGFLLWKGGLAIQAIHWKRTLATGLLLSGVYSVCFLLALQQGLTPGALAVLLAVQPILTLLLTERATTPRRVLGLLVAVGGLAAVVWDGVAAAHFTHWGLVFAGLSLTGITCGAILQKRESQPPWVVLPLHYGVGLLLAVAMLPLSPFETDWSLGFVLSTLWMGATVSVLAAILLYRALSRGNLVNVTSLFYLVPGGTAALDWVLLGNRMSVAALAGMALVVTGLVMVLGSAAPLAGRQTRAGRAGERSEARDAMRNGDAGRRSPP